MQLSTLDRILLLNLLPKEGNITNLKIIRELRESLSFSEEEHKDLNFTNKDGFMQWNNILDKNFELGDVAMTLVKEQLRAADKEEKLTEQHLPLWEKFIE